MLQNEQIPLEELLIFPWNKRLLRFPLKSFNIRGVFRPLPNISDGIFLQK